jgi:transposase
VQVPSSKVTERFETPSGQQAQFDWSPYTIELGGALMRVVVFGIVLGYSRRKHYTASLDETQASICEAIESCLRHFGAAPKQLLVDNAKAFVLDARPSHFRWNPQFLELCGHYRMRPTACQPYRPRTNGVAERSGGYVKSNALKGRCFDSLEALAAFRERWNRTVAQLRIHGTTR